MQKIKFEYRITAGYLIVGGLWILFSDRLLNTFIEDPYVVARLQTYKGWFYVVVTAVLFYSLIKKHLVRLRNAEQKAKESDRLKTAFLQNISHEIRTPMNGIIGFAELLKDNNLSDLQKNQFLEIIGKSSDQLLKIVNEVLDISLIETGTLKANIKRLNLNSFLDEIYLSFKPLIKKGVSIILKKGLSDTSSIIMTDGIKVRQILNNLLNNAIKFTDNGHIKFGYYLRNSELEFFVEDTGIGIESHQQEKVFERFRKADNGKTRLYDGVGLGLAICKGNIDLLNGRIWIKSEPGKGSTFFFTLPYETVNLKEESEVLTIPAKKNLKKGTLLVAEDDEINYLYIKQIFKGTGFEILHAVTGKEAVEICQRNSQITIILMDIKLPAMNGYEAVKIIREFRPDVKIIAQTAFALDNEREKAIKAGCNDYISKPFHKDQLLALITKHHLG